MFFCSQSSHHQANQPVSVLGLIEREGGGRGRVQFNKLGGTQVPLEKRDAQEQHDWPNTRMLPFPH